MSQNHPPQSSAFRDSRKDPIDKQNAITIVNQVQMLLAPDKRKDAEVSDLVEENKRHVKSWVEMSDYHLGSYSTP
ncbi:hypothetical protein PGQ11_005711 [Apiospora arundinis]|uniref:Uncharacterized protein n=1 Tax=Apiospora arundinis TaxID=335852 RepID=A0ABR2JD65_9PEZI